MPTSPELIAHFIQYHFGVQLCPGCVAHNFSIDQMKPHVQLYSNVDVINGFYFNVRLCDNCFWSITDPKHHKNKWLPEAICPAVPYEVIGDDGVKRYLGPVSLQ